MTNIDIERRVGQPIALVLLDEHPLTRAGVRNVLASERDISVVAEAETVDQVVNACRQLRPDVVLVDVDLPPAKMVESLRRLREECADPAVVVLTHQDSDLELYGATIAGAAGHLSDAVGPAQLADTIRRAADGDEPITDALAERPDVGRRVLETFRELAAQGTQDPSEPMPTGRQREILTHAAEGMTNQQIARHMGLSTGTVRADVSDLLRRLALRHRTEAVVHAIRRGWISPEASPSVEPQDGTEA